MGSDYSREFQNLFPEIANKKTVKLIPFILENVAGIDTLNLPDGIHPNVHGEKIVVENIWAILKDVI
jgi:acyl-CoA thioesterase-1